MLSRISCCYQQYIRFCSQLFSYLFTTVANVCQRHSSITHKPKPCGCWPIIPIARCEYSRNQMPVDVYRGMKFEAKEPSFAGLAEVCAFLAKQSDTGVTNRFADRYWLGIEYKEVSLKAIRVMGCLYQVAYNFRERV